MTFCPFLARVAVQLKWGIQWRGGFKDGLYTIRPPQWLGQ